MKNKLYIFILGFIFAITSCEVTDTIPKDSITDLNYWKSPDDIKSFVNSFYITLSGPVYNGTQPGVIYYDKTSDNIAPAIPDPLLFSTMSVPASGGGWSSDDWKNIRNLNYALKRVKTVVGTQADINHYIGELRFFRANEYFNKVKTFGDVPWVSKDLTTTDVDILYAARDPMKLVVDSIIVDLEFAAANLKNPNEVVSGRLHKFAALQMLARVCLYEGTFLKYRNISGWETYLTKAVTTAQKIMNEGGYQIVKEDAKYYFPGYPLVYKSLFIKEDLTSSKECVLSKNFILNVIMNQQSAPPVADGAGVGMTKDFIESFLCSDGLPIALSPLYLGDNSASLEFTNRDPRMRNMIDNKNVPVSVTEGVVSSWPVTPVTVSQCPTGYMMEKFHDPDPIKNEPFKGTNDWHIFRYAEVLLSFAEAKAELATISQNDLDISINLLRARLDEGSFTMGRLSMNPPADPLAVVDGQPKYGYAISPLLFEIRRERRIELASEGFRWDDIVRWHAGVLINNPKTMVGIAVNDGVRASYLSFYNGIDQFSGRKLYTITDWDGKTKQLLMVYSSTSRTWDNKLYFMPLPSDQLTLNSKLSQNPGW